MPLMIKLYRIPSFNKRFVTISGKRIKSFIFKVNKKLSIILRILDYKPIFNQLFG